MDVAEAFETMDYGPAPESPKPALDWIQAHGGQFGLFVGGEFVPPANAEYFETINPANSALLAKIAQAGESDVDAAVRAARSAQPEWAGMGGHRRARYLYALARQIQKHSRLFAVLESLDNGKPIRETRDIDIPLVARHFYYHAGWAQLMDKEMPGCVPLGVAGQIIPWNFPLLMLAWKIAPALAMGNTVVLKPAEFTPLTALLFGEICSKIELPKGVVNIITGDGLSGAALVNHPDVNKIAFTGSTEVGRIIRKATAGTGKKLSLELGGKSPFIVFDDADLDSVVEGVVDAIWFNQGQVCCAGSRLLLQESIAETMIAKLKARMETLRIGDPLDKAIDIGAIVAPVQLERIRELVELGVQEGSQKWQPSWACPTEGCFYPPTLFTEVSPASTIAQTEIFGPVLVSMTFRTPAEAVEIANNTPYGLAASVWSQNLDLALDIARQVLAGTVWINCTNQFDAASGFGGYRESGYGREGGKEGLWEYVKESKVVEEPFGENGKGVPHQQLEVDPSADQSPPIDRTAKMYIGGKQVRPDGGYSRDVFGPVGDRIGEVGEGNRKDIRNAVESARKSQDTWGKTTGHARAQILYYLAENLSERATEFAARIAQQTGKDGHIEVERSIRALFDWAAWADKYDSAVHNTNMRSVTLAMNEPIGVIGIANGDDAPLLGFLRSALPAMAMGNTLVAIPSETHPLSATDLYQVLETSDLPGGVVNIVTGDRDILAAVLAEHDDVDSIWYFGPGEGTKSVEERSAGNLKRTWCTARPEENGDHTFLRQSTQVKNIWVPYGA